MEEREASQRLKEVDLRAKGDEVEVEVAEAGAGVEVEVEAGFRGSPLSSTAW